MGIDVDVILKSPESVSSLLSSIQFLIKLEKEYAQWVTLFGFIYILFMVVSIVDDLFQKIRSVFLFQ